MIITKLQGISSIFLTVFLIINLIIVELGNKKTKSILLPIIIVLISIFIIIAAISIITTYKKL